jgi:hypothetical protein
MLMWHSGVGVSPMKVLGDKSRFGWSRGSVRALLAVSCLGLCLVGPAAWADDAQPVTQSDLQKLMQDMDLQKKKLAAQEQALAEQQRVIANQQNQLNFLKAQVGLPNDPELVPVAYNLGNAVPSGTVSGVLQAQDQPGDQKKPVGEAPPEEQQRPEVAILPEQGGVLTRKGQLILEPSVKYTHSSQDRFFFQGFEVVDTILIGLIEATKADRNLVQAVMGARIGVTDRLEFEARVPYVYRSDHVRNTSLQFQTPTVETAATGNGIGDVEIAAHYDFTDLIFDAPFKVYTVANLKVKTPTGEGPFDIPLDAAGNPTRLATGSGFWAVQPSFTAIFPTDPVVFFGSVGYTATIGEDINRFDTATRCTDPTDPATCTTQSSDTGFVEPGDSVNTSVGMGLSLNERTSVSLGFSFDYVFSTEVTTLFDDDTTDGNPAVPLKSKSDPLYVGSFQVGWSYQVSDNVGINLNFSVGATESAPDFETSLRIPIRFNVF